MDYHVDQCDVVCLLSANCAFGGKSNLASSIAVYNEILVRRPDLVTVLLQPFYWTRHGEIGPGQQDWYIISVLNFLRLSLCVLWSKHIVKVPFFQTFDILRNRLRLSSLEAI